MRTSGRTPGAPRAHTPELIGFLLVGGAGYVVDVALFNLLQTQALLGSQRPILARTLAVIAAIAVNYVGNSRWTWRHRFAVVSSPRGRLDRRREIVLFFLFSGIGFGFSVAALAISRYVLGFDGRLADNISANVIGTALGTIFRFVAYQRIVFRPQPDPRRARSRRPALVGSRSAWAVAAVCLGTVLARLPAVRAPLSPDEGGFLLVAAQWHRGTSLYGDYWVDRPPLLLDVFALAASLGGVTPLRLIGMVAACLAVVLAALIAHTLRSSPVPVAVLVAGLVSSQLLDGFQTSGELLAIPWVLAGILWWLGSERGREQGATPPRVLLLAAGAGACGAAAVLTKQNFIGTFVFIAAWLLVAALRGRRVGVVGQAGAICAGALSVGVVVLTAAWVRGASPARIWDAVVVFRAQAGQVISSHGSAASLKRLEQYPAVLLATGLFFVLLLFLLARWRRLPATLPEPLPIATAALLLWETIGVALGGSYWLHYLLALIPGLVLAVIVIAAHDGWRRRAVSLASGWAAASAAVVAIAYLGMGPPATSSTAVAEWLAAHRSPGQSAVVAYGQPNILEEAGVSSPYPQLWSLPVRVRDPRLSELTGVLRSNSAPTWVLVYRSMATWGIDPTTAQTALERRYRTVADVCGWRVYLRDDEPFPTRAVPPLTCSHRSPRDYVVEFDQWTDHLAAPLADPK